MKKLLCFTCFCVAIMFAAVSCSPVKKLDVSMADDYQTRLQKVMVVTFAKVDFLHAQFENVLANELGRRGVEATISHDVFPDLGTHIDPMLVFAKAKEILGD